IAYSLQLFGQLKQQISDFHPIIYTLVACGVNIVRRGKQYFSSLKMFQIVSTVIDQNISGQNMLMTTKNTVLPMDKWKIFIQPVAFFPQGVGKFHCSRCHIEIIL